MQVATLLDDVDETELVRMIEREQLFVAEQDGAVVGSAGWWRGALRHCYVEPAQGRQGIGSRLVHQAESDFAARSKASDITLSAVVYAIEFFRSNGYDVVSRSTAWDGSDVVAMRKRITR